ncbi:hypothetical protein [Luteibacter rhizovicinus]|nr:hypothetical protein [Luteibacter rhizovicinus]
MIYWLVEACRELELHIDTDPIIDLPSGLKINPAARIRDLGGVEGMLIVDNYDQVEPHTDEIVRAGYGFSVLDEPHQGETFDLSNYMDMFRDWGWTGSAASQPKWIDIHN